MKYLFLDTNIYIDMIVSRNASHSADSYEQLKMLLDHNQVKILVPAIIEAEVKRHIASEVKNVGDLVQEARKSIENVYWINHVEEIEKYNEKIRPLSQALGNMVDEFRRNEERYISDATTKITGLMHYRNVITIEENGDLLSKVQRRKLYKQCPFHIEDKESWADAMIIETLINIRDFVAINDDDKIYFITRNHKDFSKGNSKTDRVIIHPHIEEQLRQNNLLQAFNYRSLYTKTLIEDFADEATEANIMQQLIEEAEDERREMIDAAREHWYDMERESAGLSSLSSADAYFESIGESDEVQALINAIDSSISSLEVLIEDALDEYSQFEDDLNAEPIANLRARIQAYNTNSPFLQISYESGFSDDEVREAVLEFVDDNLLSVDDIESLRDSIDKKDHFELGILVKFNDLRENTISLSVEGELDPRNDDSDHLWVELYINDARDAYGEVEVYYGGVRYDEDSESPDGTVESIDYNLEKVTDRLVNIIQRNIDSVDHKKVNLGKLRTVLNI
ncbi:hypothetical protein PCCS19_21390 [Paenibacillus sp. CCS19]|uniref:PIN domain-containing protein n=1 Tax=Paenibacillus sp. CCS19 TaxID=3158387 RepID=UPI00255E8BC0|nr:PIN domain-containing protein [Paenibacillus cellulosilyticus]GMK39085.1 hypothetical protein PCCS19_21390 [Paenibacillus cellulosilyticus]